MKNVYALTLSLMGFLAIATTASAQGPGYGNGIPGPNGVVYGSGVGHGFPPPPPPNRGYPPRHDHNYPPPPPPVYYSPLAGLTQIQQSCVVLNIPAVSYNAPALAYDRDCVRSIVDNLNRNPSFPSFPLYPALSQVTNCSMLLAGSQWGLEKNCVDGAISYLVTSNPQQWTPPGRGRYYVAAWFQGNASFTISGNNLSGQHEIRPGHNDNASFELREQSFSGQAFPFAQTNVGVMCIDNCKNVSVQSPSPQNNFTTRVLINDTEGGRNTVKFFVYWQ